MRRSPGKPFYEICPAIEAKHAAVSTTDPPYDRARICELAAGLFVLARKKKPRMPIPQNPFNPDRAALLKEAGLSVTAIAEYFYYGRGINAPDSDRKLIAWLNQQPW